MGQNKVLIVGCMSNGHGIIWSSPSPERALKPDDIVYQDGSYYRMVVDRQRLQAVLINKSVLVFPHGYKQKQKVEVQENA